MSCQIHDNCKSSNGYGVHDQSSGSSTLVVSGNVIPKSVTQTISMSGLGSGSMGYWPTSMAGIKSFNTTDP